MACPNRSNRCPGELMSRLAPIRNACLIASLAATFTACVPSDTEAPADWRIADTSPSTSKEEATAGHTRPDTIELSTTPIMRPEELDARRGSPTLPSPNADDPTTAMPSELPPDDGSIIEERPEMHGPFARLLGSGCALTRDQRISCIDDITQANVNAHALARNPNDWLEIYVDSSTFCGLDADHVLACESSSFNAWADEITRVFANRRTTDIVFVLNELSVIADGDVWRIPRRSNIKPDIEVDIDFDPDTSGFTLDRFAEVDLDAYAPHIAFPVWALTTDGEIRWLHERDVHAKTGEYTSSHTFVSVVQGNVANACGITSMGQLMCGHPGGIDNWHTVDGDPGDPIVEVKPHGYHELTIFTRSGKIYTSSSAFYSQNAPQELTHSSQRERFEVSGAMLGTPHCVLDASGHIFCQGKINSIEEEGSYDWWKRGVDARSKHKTPVNTSARFSQLTFGKSATSSCGLETTGDVTCWGSGPAIETEHEPGQLYTIPGWPEITHIEHGYETICGQSLEGHWYCAPTSNRYVEANLSGNPEQDYTQPASASTEHHIKQLSISEPTIAGVDQRGDLHHWGHLADQQGTTSAHIATPWTFEQIQVVDFDLLCGVVTEDNDLHCIRLTDQAHWSIALPDDRGVTTGLIDDTNRHVVCATTASHYIECVHIYAGAVRQTPPNTDLTDNFSHFSIAPSAAPLVARRSSPSGVCGITDQHRKQCWNSNLAQWSFADEEIYPFTNAALGQNAGCGLSEDGEAYCFGADNGTGRTGHGLPVYFEHMTLATGWSQRALTHD